MELFINELSLHAQYQSAKDFQQAIIELASLVSFINERVRGNKMYKTDILVHREALLSTPFIASFEQISDKSFKQQFARVLFDRSNPQDWRGSQVHNAEDMFVCTHCTENDGLVSDTSLAEASERLLQDNTKTKVIINFQTSIFSVLTPDPITVLKNGIDSIDLPHFDSKESFESWFNTLPVLPLIDIGKIRYDIEHKQAPRGLIRLDIPTLPNGIPLHGEKIHITFIDKSALNYDGTWKHDTTRRITKEERDYLEANGFTVPDND